MLADRCGLRAVTLISSGELAAMARLGPQAGRAVQHDQDQRDAEQQHAQRFRIEQHLAEQRLLHRAGAVAEGFGQQRQQQAAEDDAGDVAHAAEHHHAQHHDGFEQAEALGRDEFLEAGEQPAGDAAEGGAHGEGQQLDVAGVDAAGLGGDLVLADGHPGAADARVLQADADEDDGDGQQHEQVVVEHHAREGEAEDLDAASTADGRRC